MSVERGHNRRRSRKVSKLIALLYVFHQVIYFLLFSARMLGYQVNCQVKKVLLSGVCFMEGQVSHWN